ncbi:MAG: hypothetical protein KDA55_19255 [Planctomycetales bacterium]|nr:hypothetical protein [Planctomycetales bacterium]MCA9205701.1 hypothetical protein [Planctomycetales bacterium]MCA9210508.1 hypothetical protein [Planctomycetales bacterium]MCA9222988.1 hypothetical protein [Planctomycetales bacterium]MCA9224947.1 hypothetical protein [Planctomycetales bacterium]
MNSIKIQYSNPTGLHASQFVVSGTEDDVFVDVSAGVVMDEVSGEQRLPIHSRIGMSYSAARRLIDLLQQVVRQHDQQTPATTDRPADGRPADSRSSDARRLPRISSKLPASATTIY